MLFSNRLKRLRVGGLMFFLSFLFPILGRQNYIASLKNYGFSDINSSSLIEANQNSAKEGGSNNNFIPSKNNNEVLYSVSSQVDKTENKNDSSGNQAVHLKREMGLWSGVSIIVGTIIGKLLTLVVLLFSLWKEF